jgi:hypothetical protein
MKHLGTPEIVEFVTGKSDRKQALKAKQHIDVCPECSIRVKAHHYIRNNFDEVWETWTSRKRSGDLIAERVERALTQGLGMELQSRLMKRMEAWLKRVRHSAGIAWCASVRSAGKAVDVVREHLEELVPTTVYVPQLVALPTAIQTSGAVEQTSGPKLLRTRGATKTQPTISVERSKTRGGGQNIRVKSALLKETWPLVMLIPEASGEPIVGEFIKSDEGLVAEFKGLPKADYLVVVEGRKSKQASPPKPRTRQRKRPEKKS